MYCSAQWTNIDGYYISENENIHGELIIFKEDEGIYISWTNDLWINSQEFSVSNFSNDSIVLKFRNQEFNNDTLHVQKYLLKVLSQSDLMTGKLKKITKKRMTRIVPSFIIKEIPQKFLNL